MWGVRKEATGRYCCIQLRLSASITPSSPRQVIHLYAPVSIVLFWEESVYRDGFGLVLAYTRYHITCTVVRCAVVHGRQGGHDSSLQAWRSSGASKRCRRTNTRKKSRTCVYLIKRHGIVYGMPPLSMHRLGLSRSVPTSRRQWPSYLYQPHPTFEGSLAGSITYVPVYAILYFHLAALAAITKL